MDRRTFIQSVVSTPAISLPSVDFSENESKQDALTHGEDDQWKMSAWVEDIGYLILVKNGEIEYEWEYEDYNDWHSAVRWTARSIYECKYVAGGLRVDLEDIYIDPPYFHSILKGNSAEVRARRGKYSESEYRYYIRTAEVEGEFGADDYNEMIRDIQDQLIDAERE
ncbi:hypothetical protein [Halobacterium noricense]|uniref:hypothetical protein n=1 Tax=Halobacterium noricense TaxID=223182 RepID=UPI001E4DC44B|nr:hypothetical protein [Halobacterium noricense]UHH25618.1 hypothetical protein LT974_01440 [Halobacterium noricense]